MAEELKEKKILVVDNSPLMTKMIRSYLVKLGVKPENIATATDGHQAFLITELKRFDLITSGLHMRFLDGLALLKRLRGSDEKSIREISHLLITSERRKDLDKDIERAGGNGYLSKPFRMDDLAITIEMILDPGSNGFVKLDQAPEKAGQVSEDINFDPKVVSVFVDSALEALSQYMVTATVGEMIHGEGLQADFSSWIDLTDKDADVKLVFLLLFPKKVACDIYESIFGAVDMDAVCGVVQELGNITAGITKAHLPEYHSDIYKLVHPDREWKDVQLNFKIGLPSAKMGENFYPKVFQQGVPKFTVPFTIGDDIITLQVSFQKS